MKLIVLFLVVFILFKFPFLRYVLFHPIKVSKNAIVDIYRYIRYKKYNNCNEYGLIRLNSAKTSQVFGCGKTLSLVRQARYIYNRYNNKKVWDEDSKKFVIQHIRIISNVNLYDVPYYRWVGESQFIDIDKLGFEKQDIIIYLLDEAGAIFNSRSFRKNISMEFLTRLLQSRKNKMALYMTSQRFQFTDKILRESCSYVTTCKKIWRIIELCDYDAYEVENVSNVSLLNPINRRYWLATDNDYHSYDSYQLIEQLKKDNESGNLLSTDEVLATYGDSTTDISMSTHLNKKKLKKMKV